MKRKAASVLVMMIMVLSVCTVHAEDVLDLTGYWTSDINDGKRMLALIDGDEVAVVWEIEDENGCEQYIYWVGSYIAPEKETDDYTWTSVRDEDKTDMEWLASTDDTKDFHYKNGEFSIEASTFGSSGTEYFYPTEEESDVLEEALTGTVETLEVNDAESNFEEQTLVDNDYCTIIVTGIEEGNLWGYTLNVYLENKSDDITYMFSVNDASVNGLAKDPYFAKDIAPGKISNEAISFGSLDTYGIDEVTDVALHFRVYDDDDWTADPVVNETFHIYPFGEENATKYERKPQTTDVVLVDTGSISMIITSFEEDDIWGYTANVFLENYTNSNVMFSVDDVSVNGCMIDPFWATSVPAGTCSYGSISWSNSKLEENNIDPSDISEIEMKLSIYDNDDWMAEDFVNETVTVNP